MGEWRWPAWLLCSGGSSSPGLPGMPLEGALVRLRPAESADWPAWAALRQASRDFLTPWEPAWPADALSRPAFEDRVRLVRADWRHDRAYALLTFHQAGHDQPQEGRAVARRINDRQSNSKVGSKIGSDTLVGGIALTNVRRGAAQTATLGYWVGQPFVRRGYTREAVTLLLGFAVESLGLHRIEASCLPDNRASQSLLERLGFHYEGIGRGYLMIDGARRDHLLYAWLAGDRPTKNGRSDEPSARQG